MVVFHESIDGMAHHCRRPIPLVRQLRIGIRGGDMSLVGLPLSAKRDRGITRIQLLGWGRVCIQRPNPLFMFFRFQKDFHRHKALVGGIGLDRRTIQRCMRETSFCLIVRAIVSSKSRSRRPAQHRIAGQFTYQRPFRDDTPQISVHERQQQVLRRNRWTAPVCVKSCRMRVVLIDGRIFRIR